MNRHSSPVPHPTLSPKGRGITGKFRVSDGRVSIFSVPLKRPFITALGRKSETTNVGVWIRLQNGIEGYGEASGSVVMAHLKPRRLAQTLKAELHPIVGQDIRHLLPMVQSVWKRSGTMAPAAAALECALSDAFTQSLGITLQEWFGGAAKELETDITLSAASAEDAAEAAREAVEEGFHRLKVKIGTTPAADYARVASIWNSCRRQGESPEILLDGNQSMSSASALRLVEKCLKRGMKIALLEQPLPREKIGEMAKLKKRCPVPIAADESVRTPREALHVLDQDAADVINVKVAKTGLQASLEIIAMAQAAKKQLMIGCMQETAKGLSAAAHLACGTGAFDFVDLDSDHLLARNQPQGDFERNGPRLKTDLWEISQSRNVAAIP